MARKNDVEIEEIQEGQDTPIEQQEPQTKIQIVSDSEMLHMKLNRILELQERLIKMQIASQ